MEFDKFCVSGLQGSGFLGLRLRVSIWGVLHCFCEKPFCCPWRVLDWFDSQVFQVAESRIVGLLRLQGWKAEASGVLSFVRQCVTPDPSAQGGPDLKP